MSKIQGMAGKGSLVIQDPDNPIPKIIKFQYNPETLSRSFQPIKPTAATTSTGASAGESDSSETFRVTSPPNETLSMDIELDATDKLEFPDKNPNTVAMGINPELAALESLLYPKSSDVTANSILVALGSIEIIPPEGPSIFLVWGPNRILPVSITDLKINEEAYDHNLNPIRAKVSLSFKVLNYSDISKGHNAYSIFQAHHKRLEKMALLLNNL
jgi:hypothetical protein